MHISAFCSSVDVLFLAGGWVGAAFCRGGRMTAALHRIDAAMLPGLSRTVLRRSQIGCAMLPSSMSCCSPWRFGRITSMTPGSKISAWIADVITFSLAAEVACSRSSIMIFCIMGNHDWLYDQHVLLSLTKHSSNSASVSGSRRSCLTAAVPVGTFRAESHSGLTSLM